MPDLKLAAGINFGKPATEFIVEATEAGEATSCRNVVTGVEYIGGGESSDFSTAEVTFTVVNDIGNVAIGIGIRNDMLAYFYGLDVENNNVLSYVLYKGSQAVEVVDTAEITVEGNAEIIYQGEEDGEYFASIQITGDCIIHLTGSLSPKFKQ